MMQLFLKNRHPGFSLIELLVVIGILSLLVSVLLPSLARAKDLAREATCLTRVNGQSRALHLYATEYNGTIPTGPEDRVQPWPAVPYSDLASNQIAIASKDSEPFEYSAHGLLMGTGLLSAELMFCPDDDSATAMGELEDARRGDQTDIYCSYFYRQLDEVGTGRANLDDLGENAIGGRVRALILDANSRLPGAPARFNHRGERINIAFVDGSANTHDQPHEEFFLRAGDIARISARMDEILQASDRLSP